MTAENGGFHYLPVFGKEIYKKIVGGVSHLPPKKKILHPQNTSNTGIFT